MYGGLHTIPGTKVLLLYIINSRGPFELGEVCCIDTVNDFVGDAVSRAVCSRGTKCMVDVLRAKRVVYICVAAYNIPLRG